ncbi:MAG: heme exporter protein CcmB [Deltaproteobacteria bacterium]|nr:heme exporter protein CcmB [Deltaproteobacteria bacterium]
MQLWAAARKDLRLTWRTRAQAMAVIAFAASMLLLLGFAAGPDAAALRRQAAGFLWVSILFGSVLALAESFRHERTQQALEGLLLLGASPGALFLAKAGANTLLLMALGTALVPLMAVLCDVAPTSVVGLLAVIALGAAGLAAPGTLYAAMTSQVRVGGQLLLPLLLLPLAAPVLLAASKASSLLLNGDPMGQLGSWVGLLAAFDAVYWPLGAVLFGAAVEE